MNKLRWQWRELTRLYRLMRPEDSAKLLIKTVGPMWLFIHGAKREHKIKLWKKADGWYCADIAIPREKLAVEAKGGWRTNWPRDIAKEQALIDNGWQVLFISEREMLSDPWQSRKRVRRFLRR